MYRNLLVLCTMVLALGCASEFGDSSDIGSERAASHDQNGCSVFPGDTNIDDLWFQDPCNRHDDCYQHGWENGQTKSNCDDEFYDGMLDACLDNLGRRSAFYDACVNGAITFHAGVVVAGGSSYHIDPYHNSSFGELECAPHTLLEGNGPVRRRSYVEQAEDMYCADHPCIPGYSYGGNGYDTLAEAEAQMRASIHPDLAFSAITSQTSDYYQLNERHHYTVPPGPAAVYRAEVTQRFYKADGFSCQQSWDWGYGFETAEYTCEQYWSGLLPMSWQEACESGMAHPNDADECAYMAVNGYPLQPGPGVTSTTGLCCGMAVGSDANRCVSHDDMTYEYCEITENPGYYCDDPDYPILGADNYCLSYDTADIDIAECLNGPRHDHDGFWQGWY